MTKNVTVVDEQGNQHGATYPKRAKGLVKNGRARFVDENTICLACPPNQILEDTEMSENINMNENTNQNNVLTEKEVFDQIVLLQNQLTEHSTTSLYRLGEAISYAHGEGEDAQISDEQVANICAVFAQREETLREMLELYKRMYSDVRQEKQRDEPLTRDDKIEKITMIQHSILDIMQKYQSEENFADMVIEVKNRLDALCTDILADKL